MSELEMAILVTLIQQSPNIARWIDLAAMQNDVTPEQYAAIKAARDQRIAEYDAAIKGT